MNSLFNFGLGSLVYVNRGEKKIVVEINSMTKKKIGYCDKGTNQEHYVYLRDLEPVEVNESILEDLKEKEILDYSVTDTGKFYIVPDGSDHVYQVSTINEIDNILRIHKKEIKFKDYLDEKGELPGMSFL